MGLLWFIQRVTEGEFLSIDYNTGGEFVVMDANNVVLGKSKLFLDGPEVYRLDLDDLWKSVYVFNDHESATGGYIVAAISATSGIVYAFYHADCSRAVFLYANNQLVEIDNVGFGVAGPLSLGENWSKAKR